MDKPIVGIRLANGDFFPVLDSSISGSKKRMVLSPARQDQSVVKVDLYRAASGSGEAAEYIGALHVERSGEGEAEITLIAGIDPAGNLNATISDQGSGEYQSLSVSLLDLPVVGDEEWDLPEEELELEPSEFDLGEPPAFDEELQLDEAPQPAAPAVPLEGAEESSDGRVAAEEMADLSGTRRRANPLLFIAYILLGLILLGVVAYLIFRSMETASTPDLLSLVRRDAGVLRQIGV
ncbi:hypothetical protein [Salinispira pacifica]